MLTKGKSMELALDAHAAHLLPHLDRIHRRILVGIAMYEDHRSSLEVEVELWYEDIIVVVAKLGVATIGTIGERVGRIDAYTPLHTARELVNIVDRIVGLLERRSDTHERKMTASRTAHDANAVGTKAMSLGFVAHDTNGTLQILPGIGMLGQAALGRRTRSAVFHGDNSHASVVEITAHRSNLEALRPVAIVCSTRIDDLNGAGLQYLRHVPFDIWSALIVLEIRSHALWPDLLLGTLLPTSLVARETIVERNLGLQRAKDTQLTKELDATFGAKDTMTAIGIEMQFGRHLHSAQLTVDERRAIRRVNIGTAMMERHRTGLLVELEHIVEPDINAIALTRRHSARRSIGSDISRSMGNSEVDMARHSVERIDGIIGRSLGIGSKQEREMRTSRHRANADLLGVIATLCSLGTHHAYSPLSILPCRLINRQTIGTGSAIDKIDTLQASLGE